MAFSFLSLSFVSAAASHLPDVSLSTIPVSYYGAVWERDDANIDMLTKMRIVVLMQEDGECWLKCCPNKGSGNNCQPTPFVIPENASEHAGCDPSCDQHGTQVAVFDRVRAAAKSAGRASPHCMMYMNGVYDWPFDAAHGLGAQEIDVLDINGVPHAETCDPGIYPSFLLDYGRPAGRNAFLGAIRKYVVNGGADGVFLDNFAQIPMKCNQTSGVCEAQRNHWIDANTPSIVTAERVDAYTKGKNESLTTAADLIVGEAGGTFAAFTYPTIKKKDPNGANMACINTKKGQGGDPAELIDMVKAVLGNGYKYLVVQPHRYSSPTRDDKESSLCSEYEVAKFLLALEEGCFLACNGWSEDFARPLGEPVGPAEIKNGIMRRRFSSGTEATWVVGTTNATVQWAVGSSEPPTSDVAV